MPNSVFVSTTPRSTRSLKKKGPVAISLRVLFIVLFPTFIVVPALSFCMGLIRHAARGRVYDDPATMPSNEAGVVLGTNALRPDGQPNLHFTNRMAAAARLWHTGRVKRLIVSGNNDRHGYDEPAAMRDALEALGVPEQVITLDGAGFRTLDSVVRARDVYGLRDVTFITDRFHTYRALFLAKHRGLHAIAFASADVPWMESYKSRLREVLADARACLDIYILRTEMTADERGLLPSH